jgi:hypothetical protein
MQKCHVELHVHAQCVLRYTRSSGLKRPSRCRRRGLQIDGSPVCMAFLFESQGTCRLMRLGGVCFNLVRMMYGVGRYCWRREAVDGLRHVMRGFTGLRDRT